MSANNETTLGGAAPARRTYTPLMLGLWLAVAAGLTGFILLQAHTVDRTVIGGVGLALFLVLLMMGMPIGVAMGAAGSIGLLGLGNLNSLRRSLIDIPYSSTASWTLSVIPMFIFMGLLLWRSGATTRMFAAAQAWMNWLPGGHAVTVNAAGAGLAAASGSTLGIAYALGRIGIPEMLKSGYNRKLALAAVLLAGLPGQLIPPSLLLVVYAGVSNMPVGPQLLAGVIPGLTLSAVVIGSIILMSTLFPGMAPKYEGKITWADRWGTLLRVWPVPVLIVIVIGGMYVGLFTATEAAAVGAILALGVAMAFCRGADRWTSIAMSVRGTVSSAGSLFLMIIGSSLINRFLALSGIPKLFTDLVEAANLGPTGFVLAAIGVMFVLGFFMESIAMLLIAIPIFLPTLNQLNIDLMWFGVIAVIVAETAVLTPPVGILVYLVHSLTQEEGVNPGPRITLGEVFGAAILVLPLIFIVLTLLIVFPAIVTWLPSGSASR